MDIERIVSTTDFDLRAALAMDGLDGLDHLLGLAPRDELIAAAEIAALVRLIREACPCRTSLPPD